jgi:hypothetical protein
MEFSEKNSCYRRYYYYYYYYYIHQDNITVCIGSSSSRVALVNLIPNYRIRHVITNFVK